MNERRVQTDMSLFPMQRETHFEILRMTINESWIIEGKMVKQLGEEETEKDMFTKAYKSR